MHWPCTAGSCAHAEICVRQETRRNIAFFTTGALGGLWILALVVSSLDKMARHGLACGKIHS